MLYLKWKEKEKVKLAAPETKKYMVWPHDRVGDIVLQAALWGFLGAKIFHNLENLDDFALTNGIITFRSKTNNDYYTDYSK